VGSIRIGVGDTVSIATSRATRMGKVIRAFNYGDASQSDWYIELDDPIYGYVFWKERIDGGSVSKAKSNTGGGPQHTCSTHSTTHKGGLQ
jgi:hypothetical protein